MKPRNPYASETQFHNGSGAHGKTKGAQRKKDNQCLDDEIIEALEELEEFNYNVSSDDEKSSEDFFIFK